MIKLKIIFKGVNTLENTLMQKKMVRKKKRDKKDMGHIENKKEMTDINSTITITNVNVLNNNIKKQKLPHLKIKQEDPTWCCPQETYL